MQERCEPVADDVLGFRAECGECRCGRLGFVAVGEQSQQPGLCRVQAGVAGVEAGAQVPVGIDEFGEAGARVGEIGSQCRERAVRALGEQYRGGAQGERQAVAEVGDACGVLGVVEDPGVVGWAIVTARWRSRVASAVASGRRTMRSVPRPPRCTGVVTIVVAPRASGRPSIAAGPRACPARARAPCST